MDEDLIRQIGRDRRKAQRSADDLLVRAYDEVERAVHAGERVNIKLAATELGVSRQTIYSELERRGVR